MNNMQTDGGQWSVYWSLLTWLFSLFAFHHHTFILFNFSHLASRSSLLCCCELFPFASSTEHSNNNKTLFVLARLRRLTEHVINFRNFHIILYFPLSIYIFFCDKANNESSAAERQRADDGNSIERVARSRVRSHNPPEFSHQAREKALSSSGRSQPGFDSHEKKYVLFIFYSIPPRLRLSRHRTALCVYIQSHHRHLLYSIFSLSYFIHYGMNNILAVSQRSMLFSRTMKYIAFTWIVWTCLSSDMCGWTLHREWSSLHRAQSFPSLIKKICVIYSLFHSEVLNTRLKWERAQFQRTKFTELYKSSPANKPCVCRFLTQWTANNTANECDDKK